MRTTAWLAALGCSLWVGTTASLSEDAEPIDRARWRRIFDDVAAEYRLRRESESEPLDLLDRATYLWARSGPHGGTYGAVYVWTHRGTADAVACFWRYPSADGRLSIVHELHSLSPAVLLSDAGPSRSWQPKAGVSRRPLPDAPVPAASPVGRLLQMRALCREFSACSLSARDERTELRLLPQPLYRYQSTDPGVPDGGLFAFVCSIGTDPEAFLLLEAVNTANGPQWCYTLGRFSHMNLFVNYRKAEVWRAERDEKNTISHNADHTYWVFHQPFDPALLEEPPAGK